MKRNNLQIRKLILLFVLLFSVYGNAQIGIGTTTPNSNALLDIDATTVKGGVLMPRIALTSTTSAFPLVNHVAGMTLYNTATTTGANRVSPGYYYNNGVQWLRLITEADVDTKAWSTEGNAGTSSATNFIGTTDDIGLTVKTNNATRFQFSRDGAFRAYSDGTAAKPTFAWAGATATGIWRPEANSIGFSTIGVDRFRMNASGQLTSMGNGTTTRPSFGWDSSYNTGLFKPNDQSIGFTTSGTERLRIPSANQIHGMSAGSSTLPFYSWGSHPGTGIYKPGGNNIGFSTNGMERFIIDFEGQMLAQSNGTNVLPSYSWESSYLTGMFSPTSQSIGFTTAGTERLRIPNVNQIYAMSRGTSNRPFYSFNESQSTGIYSPNINRMAFVTNGIERIRLDHDGTVGIGTQVPWEALHVVGNIRVEGALMPDGQAGQSGRLLESRGANNSPVWGPRIRKFITPAVDLNRGNRRIIEYPIPGITRNTTVIVTIEGDNGWTTPEITLDYVIVENGLVRIVIQNNTSSTILGTTYSGARCNITVID